MFVTVALMIDPADEPEQRAALVRARLLEILDEEDDTELATRLNIAD